MTETLLKDKKWRQKNSICLFLSAIPVFGWMGFLFMGKRSGRKEFLRAATVYGIISMVAYFCHFSEDVLRYTAYAIGGYESSQRMMVLGEYLALYGGLTVALVWIACLAHTLSQGKHYLQYLALRQSSLPARDDLTQNKKWRTENLWWTVWGYLPFTGGLSALYAGVRSKNAKLTRFGTVSAVCMALMPFVFLLTDVFRRNQYTLYQSLREYMATLIIAFWMINLIPMFLYRETYLDARAKEWKEDTRRQPNLGKRKWRNQNSLWQIWTFFPPLGGIGIALAGVRGKNRKVTVAGAIVSILSAVLLFVIARLSDTTGIWTGYDYWTSAKVVYVIPSLQWILNLLCILTFFYGTLIRWETLRGRANALQGYASDFERDLDLHNRMRARNLDIPDAPPQPKAEEKPLPKPEVKEQPAVQSAEQPVAAPVRRPVIAEAPAAPVNINSCSQTELMQLPGMSIAQAKHALEYRSEHGGFKSLDEFVEVLKIKPHFAVQIFSLATIGEAAAQEPTPAANAPRRRLDF